MPTNEVEPKPKIKFFLKNLRTLIKMKRASRTRIEEFVKANKQLNEPIMPTTEGTGGPMEEGMIYIMFNSNEDNSKEIFDNVYRFFWVNAPDLRFSFLDAFLVSKTFKQEQWEKFSNQPIFKNLSKTKFHQEVDLVDCKFEFDGTWKSGYTFSFQDKQIDIKGNLVFEALDTKGVLVYYNDRLAVTPSMAQRFYDIFAIKVAGEIEIQGKKIKIDNGRGIIEHGLGIFSNFHIYDWRWANLQFTEGSVHLFYHSIDLRKENEGIFEAGEGAAVMNGKWYHFQPNDFQITELDYGDDDNIPTKVPVKWEITAGKDESGKPLLNLIVTSESKISWAGQMGRENQFITNYVLRAEGTWNNNPIKGIGTLENQMHRIIK